VSQTWSAPVALGAGVVHSAHGLLPVLAPATLASLGEAQVIGSRVAGETVTPRRRIAARSGVPVRAAAGHDDQGTRIRGRNA
jgi:uncharacterized protein (DUF111 family)